MQCLLSGDLLLHSATNQTLARPPLAQLVCTTTCFLLYTAIDRRVYQHEILLLCFSRGWGLALVYSPGPTSRHYAVRPRILTQHLVISPHAALEQWLWLCMSVCGFTACFPGFTCIVEAGDGGSNICCPPNNRVMSFSHPAELPVLHAPLAFAS